MRSWLRFVGCLATALGLGLWAAPALAQLAPFSPEPSGLRAQLIEGERKLDQGDIDGALQVYSAAYAAWPVAEVQWGLGRIACARSNFGDCAAWLRAALSATSFPLNEVQRVHATLLLQRADGLPRRAPVVVLSPAQAERVATRFEEPASLNGPVDRATLWTGVSVLLVAALAGTLVAMTAGGP